MPDVYQVLQLIYGTLHQPDHILLLKILRSVADVLWSMVLVNQEKCGCHVTTILA